MRSMGQGNVFRRVSLSGGGGVSLPTMPWGMHPPWKYSTPGMHPLTPQKTKSGRFESEEQYIFQDKPLVQLNNQMFSITNWGMFRFLIFTAGVFHSLCPTGVGGGRPPGKADPPPPPPTQEGRPPPPLQEGRTPRPRKADPPPPPGIRSTARGTHPTGMHSCSVNIFLVQSSLTILCEMLNRWKCDGMLSSNKRKTNPIHYSKEMLLPIIS